MATPTSDTALQRPELSALVTEYMESQSAMMGFIGTKVMPLTPVATQTGVYPVLPKEVMMKIQDTKRAMRGKYPSSDWQFEEGFYSTSENGWEEQIDDRERRLYASKFDSDAIATQRAVGVILRGQEKRIADMVFNASNFTAHGITHEWDDAANAVPITDVSTGKNAIRSACGMLPNTLIISYSTYENLKVCKQIRDLLQYTFPGIDIGKLQPNQLAQIFDIPQVLVGGAVYDSGKKGQSATVTDIWFNEYAMLTIVSNSSNISEPCLGRTFMWTADAGSNTVVESYRNEEKRSDIIRVRHDTGESLIASRDSSLAIKSNISAACSYLFSNVTTI